MPFIDIFFWIVLIIRIAIIVAVFVALDMMLGHIAYKQGIPGRRGTKNKTLKTSADCSLTFYVQTDPPPHRNNWLPAARGADFSLFMRAYCRKPAVLNGSWALPSMQRTA